MKHVPAARRQQWLEQIDAALRGRGINAAAQVALQALAEGVEHPAVLNLSAQAHHAEGRSAEAIKLLKRARSLAPKDPHIPNTLGACLADLGQQQQALQAFDAAIRIDPYLAAAHFNRGTVLEDMSELNAARSAYERATSLDPRYVEPLAALAWFHARAGDAASARAYSDRALALSPSNLLAKMALASADLQLKTFESAAARLSELIQDPGLTPVNRAIVLGLIGDLHDAEGDPAQAFSAYQASNDLLRTLNAPKYEADETSVLEHVQRLIAWFATADPTPWRESPTARPRAADPKAHIFLVGFPRSGTTLLENVLAAHPDVVSLEEKDCFDAAAMDYLASGYGLKRLAAISSGEAMRRRDAYWSNVRKFGIEPRGRVFIDKIPLGSVLLPVVAKIFPNARVLFALRDPRDVVLSCFRRRFGMNAAMYQLLTLEGAAAYYDAVMRISEIYREILPLPQQFARYESLVDDFGSTTRAVCRFLGLDWDESMTGFAANAATRGISTPSAAQVTRGLNREGRGAWRRYGEQMAPVLPLLERWIQRFGYE